MAPIEVNELPIWVSQLSADVIIGVNTPLTTLYNLRKSSVEPDRFTPTA
jgi:hypothetical protein